MRKLKISQCSENTVGKVVNAKVENTVQNTTIYISNFTFSIFNFSIDILTLPLHFQNTATVTFFNFSMHAILKIPMTF